MTKNILSPALGLKAALDVDHGSGDALVAQHALDFIYWCPCLSMEGCKSGSQSVLSQVA